MGGAIYPAPRWFRDAVNAWLADTPAAHLSGATVHGPHKTMWREREKMTALEIDRYLGQTPCLCGDVSSWHFDCYAGKSQKQIAMAYRRVYARIRRRLYRERRAVVARMR